MTRLAVLRRRMSIRIASIPLEALAFGCVALAGVGAAVLGMQPQPKEARAAIATATAQLAPTNAATLVAATSAAQLDLQASGEQAKLLNASLPFSSAPVQASLPFQLSGDDLDRRRALLCLTQAVYYEAGFEPVAGRRAVAQVVLNRMRHPAFPNSVCGVVYQVARAPVCQFSFVCDGSLYRRPALGAWRDAEAIAQAALAGYVENSVGAATHYHADYVAPRWAPMLTKITKLGAHIFYRWPGSWGERRAFTGRYAGEPQDPQALRPPAPAEPSPQIEQAIAVAEAGPPVPRAATDVGGLLDVSKGWTLSIPDPRETGGAAARAVAEQERKAVAPPAHAASTTTAAVAIIAPRNGAGLE